MQFASLKRWHWMLIGVALGLLFGYVRSTVYSDLDALGITQAVSHRVFEDALKRPVPGTDRLQIRNITVYRRPGRSGNEAYVAAVEVCYPDSQAARDGKLKPSDAPYEPHWYEPQTQELKASLAALRKKNASAAPEKSEGVTRFLRKLCEGLGIKPQDPPDGLIDYLRLVTDYKGRHLDFSYAWWTQPRVQILGWSLGGFIGIGLIWPTIVNLIAFGKFFRPREPKQKVVKDKAPSLRGVKSTATVVGKTAAQPSQKDMDELLELEKVMEAQLKDSGLEITPAAAPEVPEAAAPTKKLTATEMDAAKVPSTPEDDKHFDRKTGDYYPVERHVKKDETDGKGRPPADS